MRFLIDADLPESLIEVLGSRGHDAVHVRSLGLAHAADSLIAARARTDRRCVITADHDFSDIREYPPGEFEGIVVLGLPVDATVIMIRILLDDFLNYEPLINEIRGKLVIVEPGRIRVRD